MQNLEFKQFPTRVSEEYFQIVINQNLNIVACYIRALSPIKVHLYTFPWRDKIQVIELQNNQFFASLEDPVYFFKNELIILSDKAIRVYQYNKINGKFEPTTEVILPFNRATRLHTFIYHQQMLIYFINPKWQSFIIYKNWKNFKMEQDYINNCVFYTNILPSNSRFVCQQLPKINQILKNSNETQIIKNWQFLILKIKSVYIHTDEFFINKSKILEQNQYQLKWPQQPSRIIRKFPIKDMKNIIICKRNLVILHRSKGYLIFYCLITGSLLKFKKKEDRKLKYIGVQYSDKDNRVICWNDCDQFFEIVPLLNERHKETSWRQL